MLRDEPAKAEMVMACVRLCVKVESSRTISRSSATCVVYEILCRSETPEEHQDDDDDENDA
jgi:hypothetical protein